MVVVVVAVVVVVVAMVLVVAVVAVVAVLSSWWPGRRLTRLVENPKTLSPT